MPPKGYSKLQSPAASAPPAPPRLLNLHAMTSSELLSLAQDLRADVAPNMKSPQIIKKIEAAMSQQSPVPPSKKFEAAMPQPSSVPPMYSPRSSRPQVPPNLHALTGDELHAVARDFAVPIKHDEKRSKVITLLSEYFSKVSDFFSAPTQGGRAKTPVKASSAAAPAAVSRAAKTPTKSQAAAASACGADSEALPVGWERLVDVYGRVYYADHENRITQWERPSTFM